MRLPLDTRAQIHWQRFHNRDASNQDAPAAGAGSTPEPLVDAMAAARLALMELSTTLASDAQSAHESAPSSLAAGLAQNVLWTAQDEERNTVPLEPSDAAVQRQTALWLFQVDYPSSSALNVDVAETQKALDAIRNQLAKAGMSCTSGSFTLADAYPRPNRTPLELLSDPSLLEPREVVRQPLRYLLRAFEDYFIRKWVWTREHDRRLADPTHSRKHTPPKSDSLPVPAAEAKTSRPTSPQRMEVDDEEEGALEGAAADGVGPIQSGGRASAKGSQSTPQGLRCSRRSIARFGRGVVVQDPTQTQTSLLQLGKHTRPLHLGLRCFTNDAGDVFLWTFARHLGLAYCLLGLKDTEAGTSIMLGPMGAMARFKSRQELVSDSTIAPSAQQSSIQSAREKVLHLLHLNGVATDALQDEWILCTGVDGRDMLWPAQLCYAVQQSGDSSGTTYPNAVTFTPLEAVSESALSLVREGVGLKSMIAESDINSTESDKEETEDEEEEEEEEEEVEGTYAKNKLPDSTSRQREPSLSAHSNPREEDMSGDRNGRQVSPGSNFADKPVQVNVHHASTDDRRASLADSDTKMSSTAAPLRRSSGEDDLDLWGSFGFGDQAEIGGDHPDRNREGADDTGGFGLVTEDDFAFFDDGDDFVASYNISNELGEAQAQAQTDMAGHAKDGPRALSPQDAQHATKMRLETQQFHDDNGSASAMHGTDTTSGAPSTIDPPSLPGFTPGSLSTSSPTVGGLSNKTPRTPYSPNQDLGDMHLSIEGERDHDVYRLPYGHPSGPHEGEQTEVPDIMNAETHALLKGRDSFPSQQAPQQNSWMQRHRRNIQSKYEEGKFALPLLPHGIKHEDGHAKDESHLTAEQHSGNHNDKNSVRNRLHQRTAFPRGTHTHMQESGRASVATLQKTPLDMLQGGDENSEKTENGSPSDWSSAEEDESDDDESMISTEDESAQNERTKSFLDLFDAAARCVQSWVPVLSAQNVSPRGQGLPRSASCNAELRLSDEQIEGILTQMTDNLHLRKQAERLQIPSSHLETLSAKDTQHLFVPFAGYDWTQLEVGAFVGATEQHKPLRGGLYTPEPPSVIVGCQDSVVSMTPTCLPFWDKIRLQAISGPKNIVAYGLHTGELKSYSHAAYWRWFAMLAQTFTSSAFGSHTLAADGLLSLGGSRNRSIAHLLDILAENDEQWSDTLASLLSRFQKEVHAHRHVVLYAIGFEKDAVPRRMWALSKLEDDLRKLAAQQHGAMPQLINVRYVSHDALCASQTVSGDPTCSLMSFAASLYDSLPTAVLPSFNSEDHLPTYDISPVSVRTPCFTVCPSDSRTRGSIPGRFGLDWKAESHNPLERGAFLHVGYRLAKSPGDITMIAVTDERGQEYTATGWRRASDASMEQDIQRLWNRVVEQTQRTRVLWRVVICKDRPMASNEVSAWSHVLRTGDKSTGLGAASALDVTLICIDRNMPITMTLPSDAVAHEAVVASGLSPMPARPGGTATGGTGPTYPAPEKTNEPVYIDPSRTHYAVLPATRVVMPLSLEEGSDTLTPLRSVVLLTIPQLWVGSAPSRPERLDGLRDAEFDPATSCLAGTTTASHPLWIHVLQLYSASSNSEDSTSTDSALPGPAQAHHAHAHAAGSAGGRGDATWLDARLDGILHSFQALELIARERALLRQDMCRHLPWHLAILAFFETCTVPLLAKG